MNAIYIDPLAYGTYKRESCTYANKYKALRKPKCGCFKCNKKWQEKITRESSMKITYVCEYCGGRSKDDKCDCPQAVEARERAKEESRNVDQPCTAGEEWIG